MITMPRSRVPLQLASIAFVSAAASAMAQLTVQTTPLSTAPITQTQTTRLETRTVTTQVETETVRVEKPAARLKAAIFVNNRAGKELDEKLDVLNDMITARLAGKGFAVIDRKDVMKRFTESREQIEQDKTLSRLLTLPNAATKISEGDMEAGVANAVEAGSALRVAQLLGADYILVASINSLGTTSRNLNRPDLGLTSNNTSTTLRVALKVQDGRQGGSVYGDLVTVSEQEAAHGDATTVDTDKINRLLDAAAVQIAENVGKRTGEINAEKPVAEGLAEFAVRSNVPNVAVKLDGVVVGSTGARLKAVPGLHYMEVQSEWFRPWRNHVNIQAGMELNVQLELSDAGLAKFKDQKGFEAALRRTDVVTGVVKDQGAADASATRTIAEGEKAFLENAKSNLSTLDLQKQTMGSEGRLGAVDPLTTAEKVRAERKGVKDAAELSTPANVIIQNQNGKP